MCEVNIQAEKLAQYVLCGKMLALVFYFYFLVTPPQSKSFKLLK